LKILVVGDWHSELHEEVVAGALRELGHEVGGFAWCDYFRPLHFIDALSKRIQNRFITGPAVRRLNRDLIRKAEAFSPDMIFIYRGTHVTARTLQRIRERLPSVTLVGYNNDDPFAEGHPYSLWRHFFKAVPCYDLMLAYRWHNIDDFFRIGARRVELLRSWYVPERNRPVSLSDADQARYACDVVFVGHYEKDHRQRYLEALVREGIRVKLFGPGYDWDPVIRHSPELRHLVPVQLVWGDDYNRALCGAKIALCFLSKLNRDTYTRRCFEIPATRTLMLSEFTEDLAGLFRQGVEADFFRSEEDLVARVKHYLADDAKRAGVAEAGYRRVREDGHDVVSRMAQVLDWVGEIRGGDGL